MAKVPNRTTFLRERDAARVQAQTREREREPRGDGIGPAGRGPRIALGAVWCKAPGGGIASGATADCYVYDDTDTLTSDQVSVLNRWPDAIPGSKKIALIAGVPFWSCANGPS